MTTLPISSAVRECDASQWYRLPEEISASSTPVVLRGMIADWPLVRAGQASAQAASLYLLEFYDDATIGVFLGEPETNGRVFYNDDMSGFNYQPAMAKLNQVLDRLQQHLNTTAPPMIYVGSTTVDTCLPGFRTDNDIEIAAAQPLASIWLGNRTRIAAHHDLPDNLACNAVGRRRFTLFPPDQLNNLYVGPLDFTPAGQAISLVDFHHPDYERFPRFRDALSHAQVTELAPGDAIFIPSMWWHHVESLEPLNVLINYWWRQSPAFMGPPIDALLHSLLAIRELPPMQRQAWESLFQHYVFGTGDSVTDHIPEHRRGVLGPIDERIGRELRLQLLNRLNR